MSSKNNNGTKYRIGQIAKSLFGWCIAIMIAFLVSNIFCFIYERQPGWLDTPNGASTAVREPFSWVVHGTEGYSISRMDRNGYSNPDKELADEYILMMGASHTQGKEIAPDKKYSVLVNDFLSDDGKLHTYNIGCDGSFLPAQLKHFKAAMKAFPDAKVVTIEILDTDYSPNEIEDSINQAEYDPNDSAVYFERMSLKNKIKNYVKSYLPMLSKIKKNIETVKKAKEVSTETQLDLEAYGKAINVSLAQIRSECDAPIVFIYHPGTIINPDGTISLKYSQTYEIFKQACNNNDIDIIDSGNDFLNYYETNKKVPYGFMNTSLGEGHLNAVGHRILADEIIRYLEGLK